MKKPKFGLPRMKKNVESWMRFLERAIVWRWEHR